MKLRIEFASIDAKDGIAGYDTVAFTHDDRPAILGQFNGRLAMRLQREYLTRLFQLQEELRLNYLSQWEANDTYILEEQQYRNGLTKEDYEEQENELIVQLPGPLAQYYT